MTLHLLQPAAADAAVYSGDDYEDAYMYSYYYYAGEGAAAAPEHPQTGSVEPAC